MHIDFVADINCPWCTLGFIELDNALRAAGFAPEQVLEIQPFELNPQLGEEGIGLVEYLTGRYGSTAEQIAQTHNQLRERGAAVGFSYAANRDRIWNSFNSQRLLHWAQQEQPAGSQYRLYRALIDAYQGQGLNTSDNPVLLALVEQLGLDAQRAQQVLENNEFATAVRERQQRWQQAGINAVPSSVIDQQHLVQGAQPEAVWQQVLAQLAAEKAGK